MLKRTYPGSASLFQDLGRNIVLHEALERIHVDKKFCDIQQGIIMIRGENIILIGELNDTTDIEDHLERVSVEVINELQAERKAVRKELVKKRTQLFAARGLGMPDVADIFVDDG